MTETREALACFASASLRALFLPSVPSMSNETHCEPALRASISAPSTLCCRPILPASGAISRGSAPTCSYEKSWSGGNPGQEPRLLLHRPFALTQKYSSAHKGNGCHYLAVLPQSRRSPLSFEANHSRMFSLVARPAVR